MTKAARKDAGAGKRGRAKKHSGDRAARPADPAPDGSARPATTVAAGMTGAEALSALLRAGAAEYDRQRALVLESSDPEPTHKARVALRRMRAIVGGFAPIQSADGLRSFQRDLRRAFRAFGPLRDADVRAAEFAGTPAADAHAAAAATLREELRARLSDGSAQTLAAQVEARLGDADFWRKGAGRRLANAPASVIGQLALQEAWAAMLAFGDDLSALSIEDRHEFRKDAKSMRYLTEAFRPLWPADAAKGFLSRMTKLQDALGIMNDIAGLRAHAEEAAQDAEGTGGGQPHIPDDLAADLAAREAAAARAAQKGWDRLRDKGPWWTDAPRRAT
ncbi:CHAD domain-containing protein [Paracoccus aeridis]|uniref:CHAD domain-containing protein n=1 Tax=Paracoccus aeridis TaxID=1966466 RepID=UPI0010AB3C8F|nr:CHAD domain-containing protein [Paracoccus aeridis]